MARLEITGRPGNPHLLPAAPPGVGNHFGLSQNRQAMGYLNGISGQGSDPLSPSPIFYGCLMREMILAVTDIYRSPRRIQRLSTFSTYLPIHQADLAPGADSLPSWSGYLDSDEQN